MKQTRIVFGLLIMILFAVPILFGVIWAVGFTQAVVSQKTLSATARRGHRRDPRAAGRDDAGGPRREFRHGLRDADLAERHGRSGHRAQGRDEGRPASTTGCRRNSAPRCATIGDILNGRSDARDVWLDMRPLKSALAHPAMKTWLAQVLERLPDCTPGESAAWEQALRGDGPDDSLPACRPAFTGEIAATATADAVRQYVDRDIPDRVNLMENADFPHGRFNLAKTVTSFTYLLFLIPAAFILLGALIGGGSKSLFFRWSGAAIMAGGGLVLALSSLVKGVIPWALRVGPAYSSPHWNPWQDIFADHAGGLALVISRHFMSPVITVAGAVCVVGLLLFAFSFTFTRENAA